MAVPRYYWRALGPPIISNDRSFHIIPPSAAIATPFLRAFAAPTVWPGTAGDQLKRPALFFSFLKAFFLCNCFFVLAYAPELGWCRARDHGRQYGRSPHTPIHMHSHRYTPFFPYPHTPRPPKLRAVAACCPLSRYCHTHDFHALRAPIFFRRVPVGFFCWLPFPQGAYL